MNAPKWKTYVKTADVQIHLVHSSVPATLDTGLIPLGLHVTVRNISNSMLCTPEDTTCS